MSEGDPILTVKQLADRHGLSRDIVYRWIRRSGLPTVKVGGYRVRVSDFEMWWASKSQGGLS